MNFNNFLLELWNEPFLRYGLCTSILLVVFYLVLAAIVESVERQQVIVAAKKWAENKQRRNQREEAKDLWDSVNALKRGTRQQRHNYGDKQDV